MPAPRSIIPIIFLLLWHIQLRIKIRQDVRIRNWLSGKVASEFKHGSPPASLIPNWVRFSSSITRSVGHPPPLPTPIQRGVVLPSHNISLTQRHFQEYFSTSTSCFRDASKKRSNVFWDCPYRQPKVAKYQYNLVKYIFFKQLWKNFINSIAWRDCFMRFDLAASGLIGY